MNSISKLINRVDKLMFSVDTFSKEKFLLNFYEISNNDSLKGPFVFNYLYIGSLYYAQTSQGYFKAIRSSHSLHVDGFFLGWLIRIINRKRLQDFTTSDYLDEVFQNIQKLNKKVFMLGSDDTPKGLKGALEAVRRQYPNLRIEGHQGYFDSDLEVIKKIRKFNPSLLLVGLGIGKQETWVYKNRSRLVKIKTIITVGNYIDILGGKQSQPSRILKRLHIRWLVRLLREPGRLWKRYLFGFLLGMSLLALAILRYIRQLWR